jgi:glutaredoxin
MKKIILCIALLALIQSWGSISGFFESAPAIAANNDTQVVMYSTDWCGYCKQARSLFKSAGVEYHEYNIEKSAEGLKQYKALGGRGVPLIIINGKILRGFDKGQILRELASD